MKFWRPSLLSLSRWSVARVAVAVGAGVVGIGGIAGLSIAGGPTELAAAAMKLPGMLPDPMAILSARSPGERGAGAMFNTKPPKQRLLAKAPTKPLIPGERMLSTVRERAPGGWAPPTIELPDQPFAFVPELPVSGTPTALGPLPPGNPGGFNPPPVFPTGPNVPVPQPGVTPTPTPTPTPGIPTPEAPGPAVPEPATWATMLVGFMVIGVAMRRRGARARKLDRAA